MQFKFYKTNHYFSKFARSSKKLFFFKLSKIKCYVITQVFILWSWLKIQNYSPIHILFSNTKVFLLASLVLDLQSLREKRHCPMYNLFYLLLNAHRWKHNINEPKMDLKYFPHLPTLLDFIFSSLVFKSFCYSQISWQSSSPLLPGAPTT